MEAPRSSEVPLANVGLDDFRDNLYNKITVNGEALENDDQMFYAWLGQYFPEFNNIDGVSARALYEINMMRKDPPMKVDEFKAFCHRVDIPNPWETDNDPDNKYYFYVFEWRRFKSAQQAQNNLAYETWADENGIDTRPGAIMRFKSVDGEEHVLSTAVATRGESVP